MIPEFIKRQREKTFSECRRLSIKINGIIQEESQESASLGKASIQTPKDSNRIYNICDCCQKSDIQNEQMTHIESGQRLCPACLRAFRAASQNTSNLTCWNCISLCLDGQEAIFQCFFLNIIAPRPSRKNVAGSGTTVPSKVSRTVEKSATCADFAIIAMEVRVFYLDHSTSFVSQWSLVAPCFALEAHRPFPSVLSTDSSGFRLWFEHFLRWQLLRPALQ